MEENKKKERSIFWKGAAAGLLTGIVMAAFLCLGIKETRLTETLQAVPEKTVVTADADAETGDADSGPGVAAQEEEKQTLNRAAIAEKIDALQYAIDRYFLFDEDYEQVENGIYKGMMAGLNDPYTEYYTPEEYRELTEETEGVYCGIGVLVNQNINTGIVTALRVFKGSPAEEAGMLKGDILYKVGDTLADEKNLDVLVKQDIRGQEGTYVDIVVVRDGEEITLHVERRIVESQTVEYRMLPEDMGYILVTQFELSTAQQFKDAVDDLTAQGMKGLVIDLRDNPGGVVDACVEMAAYILPDETEYGGTILSTKDKNGKGIRYYTENGQICFEENDGGGGDSRYPKEDSHQVDVPIAILLNGQSASASEVFSGALRDYGKATLVGTTSYGKGIIQSLFPMQDGSALKITVAHYYTPSGYDLHKKGLTPDVEIEQELDEELKGQYDIPYEKDNQLQKAVEVISKN